MESARSFLQTQGIDAYEQSPQNGEVIFQVADKKIIADAGDRVLSAQAPTDALQFPCGYRVDVILRFGKDNRLKQDYIQRFRIYP